MPSTEPVSRNTKTIKKIAAKVASQAVQEIDDEFEAEDTHDGNDVDIFVGAAQDILRAGEHPLFNIQRNGEFLTTKAHPYSWDQLQKEFGPGSYKVSARIKRTGAIKKWQTQQIADPRPPAGIDFDFAGESSEPSTSIQAPTPKPSFMEMYLLKSDMDEKSRLRQKEMEDRATARQQEIEAKLTAKQAEIDAKLREIESKKESASTDMFKMMISMQQESAKQLQAIQADSTKTILGLMTSIMAKPKDEGIKPHELLKMLSDAEKHGYERMERMTEKVEKLAEARAEEMAERSSGNDPEESLIKTVVKGFIPLISQAINNPNLMKPQPQQPSPQEIEHYRRIEAQRKLQHENAMIAQRQKASQAPKPVVVKANEVSAKNPVPIPAAEPKQDTPIGVTVAPIGVKNGAVTNMKEKIKTLVIPLLAEDLMANESPVVAAEKSRVFLAGQGIGLKIVLENFTLKDMLSIADEYKLPEEVKPWLKEFYEYLANYGSQVKQTVAEPPALQQ